MGNMTVSAEFNFYYDPEAAYIVLNQLTSPITMVTWETCEKHALSWVSRVIFVTCRNEVLLSLSTFVI